MEPAYHLWRGNTTQLWIVIVMCHVQVASVLLDLLIFHQKQRPHVQATFSGPTKCICRQYLPSDLLDHSCVFSWVVSRRLTSSLCPFLLPGHYIYVDTSFAKQGEKAVLLSSDVQTEEWSCLRLVYQITTSSGSPSEPSRLNLYVRFDDESFDRLLWSAKEPSDSWLIASLDLQNSSKKFKVGRVYVQGFLFGIMLF